MAFLMTDEARAKRARLARVKASEAHAALQLGLGSAAQLRCLLKAAGHPEGKAPGGMARVALVRRGLLQDISGNTTIITDVGREVVARARRQGW